MWINVVEDVYLTLPSLIFFLSLSVHEKHIC